MHAYDFYTNLLSYQVGAPDWFFRIVAVMFPWIEIISGGLLLAGLWVETIGILVTAQCLVFVLMLGQAVLRGLDLQCGCFGGLTAPWLELPSVAFVRACLLLAAAVWLVILSDRREAMRKDPAQSADVAPLTAGRGDDAAPRESRE
jgi:hypothetical protein